MFICIFPTFERPEYNPNIFILFQYNKLGKVRLVHRPIPGLIHTLSRHTMKIYVSSCYTLPRYPPGRKGVFLLVVQRKTLGHQASSHRCHCSLSANSPASKIVSLLPAVSFIDTVELSSFELKTLLLAGFGHM